ncbi:hypothetical protein RIF29_42223 [Crotalaria pallida]|uniref:Transmembrane protein n=1 Tax=Crotalaria pallida TaxID=3830 RepID=A0AAN9ECI7_CROPI
MVLVRDYFRSRGEGKTEQGGRRGSLFSKRFKKNYKECDCERGRERERASLVLFLLLLLLFLLPLFVYSFIF